MSKRDGRSGRRIVDSLEAMVKRSKAQINRESLAKYKRQLREEEAAEKRAKDARRKRKLRHSREMLRRLARRALVKLRHRQQEERRRVLAELKARFARELEALRQKFAERRASLDMLDLLPRERAKRARELARNRRKEERAMRSAQAGDRRAAAAKRAREARQESDDATRYDIEHTHPEWLPLWDKVKRSIKAAPHMTRAEAFYQFVHENPDEVFLADEEAAERAISAIASDEEKYYREQHPEWFEELEKPATKQPKGRKAKRPKPAKRLSAAAAQKRLLVALKAMHRDEPQRERFPVDQARIYAELSPEAFNGAVLALTRSGAVRLSELGADDADEHVEDESGARSYSVELAKWHTEKASKSRKRRPRDDVPF